MRRAAKAGLFADYRHCNLMCEGTRLRVFWIEANRNSLLRDAAIYFNFSDAAARALWIVAEQDAEHAQ